MVPTKGSPHDNSHRYSTLEDEQSQGLISRRGAPRHNTAPISELMRKEAMSALNFLLNLFLTELDSTSNPNMESTVWRREAALISLRNRGKKGGNFLFQMIYLPPLCVEEEGGGEGQHPVISFSIRNLSLPS